MLLWRATGRPLPRPRYRPHNYDHRFLLQLLMREEEEDEEEEEEEKIWTLGFWIV